MVHCVASIDMLAGGGGCGSAVSAFPDADLFMTYAAALHSLGELSFLCPCLENISSNII